LAALTSVLIYASYLTAIGKNTNIDRFGAGVLFTIVIIFATFGLIGTIISIFDPDFLD